LRHCSDRAAQLLAGDDAFGDEAAHERGDAEAESVVFGAELGEAGAAAGLAAAAQLGSEILDLPLLIMGVESLPQVAQQE